ncbi:MAG TPA: capsule assembly Wzi family protein [Pseudidiomarina sp.]|nr:capsule assembly Wzi family protein [Pseudidiomarina sp.]
MTTFRRIALPSCCAIALAMWSTTAVANVWVERSDSPLLDRIELLANAGKLRTSTTSYPLSWRALARDLELLDVNRLTRAEREAVMLLQARLQTAARGTANTQFKLVVNSNDDANFPRHLRSSHQRAEVQVAHAYTSGDFAARVSVQARLDAIDDEDFGLDESYLAWRFDGLTLGIDTLSTHWGVASDHSLLLSDGARPLPKLRVSYQSDRIIGTLSKFHFQSFVGARSAFGDDYNEPVWANRISFQSAGSLQFGLTHVMSALDSNTNPYLTDDERWHAVSADGRLGLVLGQQTSAALYAELGADLENSSSMWLAGFSAHHLWGEFQLRAFAEVSAGDEFDRAGFFNINHHYGRPLGRLAASDATAISAGLRATNLQGERWELIVRDFDASDTPQSITQQSDRYAPLAAATRQLALQHSRPLGSGLASMSIERWETDWNNGDTGVNAQFSYELRF